MADNIAARYSTLDATNFLRETNKRSSTTSKLNLSPAEEKKVDNKLAMIISKVLDDHDKSVAAKTKKVPPAPAVVNVNITTESETPPPPPHPPIKIERTIRDQMQDYLDENESFYTALISTIKDEKTNAIDINDLSKFLGNLESDADTAALIKSLPKEIASVIAKEDITDLSPATLIKLTKAINTSNKLPTKLEELLKNIDAKSIDSVIRANREQSNLVLGDIDKRLSKSQELFNKKYEDIGIQLSNDNIRQSKLQQQIASTTNKAQAAKLYKALDVINANIDANTKKMKEKDKLEQSLIDIPNAIEESRRKSEELQAKLQDSGNDKEKQLAEKAYKQSIEQTMLLEKQLLLEKQRLIIDAHNSKREDKKAANEEQAARIAKPKISDRIQERSTQGDFLGDFIGKLLPLVQKFESVIAFIQKIAAFISSSVALAGALIGAFAIATLKSKNFRKFIGHAFEIGKKIIGFVKDHMDDIKIFFDALWIETKWIWQGLTYVWNAFERGIDAFWGFADSLISGHFWDDVINFFSELWTAFKDMFGTFLSPIFMLIEDQVNNLRYLIKNIIGYFVDMFTFLKNAFVNLIHGDFKAVFSDLGDFIKKTFSRIIDTISHIVRNSTLGKILGFGDKEPGGPSDGTSNSRDTTSALNTTEDRAAAQESLNATIRRNAKLRADLEAATLAKDKSRIELLTANLNKTETAINQQRERIGQYERSASQSTSSTINTTATVDHKALAEAVAIGVTEANKSQKPAPINVVTTYTVPTEPVLPTNSQPIRR